MGTRPHGASVSRTRSASISEVRLRRHHLMLTRAVGPKRSLNLLVQTTFMLQAVITANFSLDLKVGDTAQLSSSWGFRRALASNRPYVRLNLLARCFALSSMCCPLLKEYFIRQASVRATAQICRFYNYLIKSERTKMAAI